MVTAPLPGRSILQTNLQPLACSKTPSIDSSVQDKRRFESSQAGDAKVVKTIKKGNKIEAIKIYRELHNVELAAAKQVLELLEAKKTLFASNAGTGEYSYDEPRK